MQPVPAIMAAKMFGLLRMDSNRNVMYSKMFGGSRVEEALDLQEFPGQG